MDSVTLPMSLPALVGLSLIILGILYSRSISAWNKRSRGLPLPPGPRPIPIIGNVFDFPITNQKFAFRDMCARYGDIVHFNVLGQHAVVLGSFDAMFKLLNQHSANTPDRYPSPLVEMVGMDKVMAVSRYGQTWKRHRRDFWQYFRPNALAPYQSIQNQSAHRFLHKILQTPSRLKEHIRFTFSAAILEVLFGRRVADEGDEIINIVEKALEWVADGLSTGKFWIETLPIIRSIPPWFPGARAHKLISYWRSTVTRLKEEPYRRVKAAMERNEPQDSIASNLITWLHKQDRDEKTEEDIKNVVTVAIEGASDTTFSSMQTFFMLMAYNPEVQKRAQAELEAVVGPHRLPDFGDKENLIYINATILELLRWNPVFPFSVPHRTLEDDEHQGYFLPAGTVILPNIWACARSSEVYENPDEFRPERFIRDGKLDFSNVLDPNLFAYGFGRRICPGRYYGENALFINIASILHVFDITPPVDEKGQPIANSMETTDGLLSYPVNCQCTIKPRSSEAKALVEEAYAKLSIGSV